MVQTQLQQGQALLSVFSGRLLEVDLESLTQQDAVQQAAEGHASV